MKTRSASLQVAHQKACPMAGRAGFDSLDGCTCKPSYFTFYRDSTGRIVRGDDGTGEIVGRTRRRRDAERWLARLLDRIEQGNGDPNRRQSMAFPAWVDEYEADLAKRVARGAAEGPHPPRLHRDARPGGRRRSGTPTSARSGKRELDRFIDSYGDDASDATLRRALRELSACLTAAVDEGYAERNPVRLFVKKRGLERDGVGKDPFTDGELPKLWAALRRRTANGAPAKGSADPVYLHLCRVAVAMGARLGELLALDWDHVSLTERTVRIEHTWNVRDGLTPPKTKGSVRTIYLSPAALAEFESIAASGSSGPVFVGPRGERLNAAYVTRALTRAMTEAKIAKLGENGRPRSFHSLPVDVRPARTRAGPQPGVRAPATRTRESRVDAEPLRRVASRSDAGRGRQGDRRAMTRYVVVGGRAAGELT